MHMVPANAQFAFSVAGVYLYKDTEDSDPDNILCKYCR